MNLYELQVFLTVAKERSFSRAADTLCRSQPAVSQAIHRLEQDIDQSLFDRSLKNGSLTSAGELLVVYGERVLQLVDAAERALRTLRDTANTHVVVGADACTVHVVLPLIAALQRVHGDLTVRVRRTDTARSLQEVSNGTIDFAITAARPHSSTLSAIQIATDRLVALLDPAHRRASATELALEELREEVVIVLDDTERGNTLSRVPADLKAWSLEAVLPLPTLDAVKRAAELRVGVGLLPRSCAETEILSGRLIAIPIAHLSRPQPVYLIHRARRPRSNACEAFLAIAQGRANGAPRGTQQPMVRRA